MAVSAVLVLTFITGCRSEVLKNHIPEFSSDNEALPGPATETYSIRDGIGINPSRLQIPNENRTGLTVDETRELVTPEGRLFRELMLNYEKSTRPVMNASHVVNINLTFTFQQVLDVEEKEQTMLVILWMDHYWYDEKLIWDPADFDGIELVKIPSSEIWLPDIVLYNTAEDKIKKATSHKKSRAFVYSNGSVFWPPIMRYYSSCNIDITYFPFDDQICFLKLGSWAYDGFQVDIWNLEDSMDMSHALTNSEFQVINSQVRRYVTVYDCCIEPYIDIKVYLHIRRQTIQHVFNIVIPCVVLSIICMVGFLIPPDKNDEKISLQLTVLFSLSLFMLMVAESTPRTSESVPLMSVYLTALMCTTALSTTAHVVCDKLVASANVRNEIPYLLNRIRYELVKCCNYRAREKSNPVSSDKDEFHSLDETDPRGIQHPTPLQKPTTQKPLKPKSTRSTRGKSMPMLTDSLMAEKESVGGDITEETEKGLNGLFHHLKIRQDKMRTDLKEAAKWYSVAAKMDRIFFWMYGLLTTILTLYAFLFKPMQKQLSL